MADSKKSQPFLAGANPGSSRVRVRTTAHDATPGLASTSTGYAAVYEPHVGSIANDKTQVSQRPPLSDNALKSQTATAGVVASLIGKRLLHFELQSFVGGGGMGAVFRGHDTSLDRIVAVKVLSQDSIDDETIRRFRVEAQSVARLDHPNIPDVYFLGEADGWHFIVFEYIEGQNIRDLVEHRGPLAIDDVLKYVLQIAEAVEHANERGVVHRDIKPSNVLVTPSGKAKLVDMGLARFGQLQSSSEDLTATGVTLGTFDYISPEQARDPRNADVRSDIYSLGCTVYYMLTGRPPFPDGTALQKLLSHTTDSPADPREFRDDVPDELRDVLGKMLAKLPPDRQQTPNELRAELLMIAKQRNLVVPGQQATTVVIERQVSAQNVWLPFLPWIAVASILALTAIGLEWQAARDVAQLPSRDTFAQDGRESRRSDADDSRTNEGTTDASSSSGGNTDTLSSAASEGNAVRRSNDLPLTTTGAQGSNQASDRRSANETDTRSDVRSVGAELAAPNDSSNSGNTGNGGTAAEAPTGLDSVPSRPISSGTGARAMVTPPSPSAREARIAPRTPLQIVVADSSSLTSVDELTLVVDDLERALQLATATESVEAIEIRSNKPFVVSPFAMYNRDLLVTAAPGYRPTWQFAPTANDLESRRGLVQVSNGSLRLEGLAITVEMPSTNGQRYSLFELSQARAISLRDSSITVKNSNALGYGAEFAVIELRSRSTVTGGYTAPESTGAAVYSDTGAVRIDLIDCLVRGEATLLRANEMMSVRLVWTNGLFVSSERLLNFGGRTYPGSRRDEIEVTLENVTAMANRGLALISTIEAARNLLPLLINAKDNVLISPHALIVQVGENTSQSFSEQMRFLGENNHYVGNQVIWEIDARQDQQPQSFDFDRWKSYWMSIDSERKSERNDLHWSQPLPTQRPTYMQEAADYRITSLSRRGGALLDSRQTLPGAILNRLPIPATVGFARP